MPGPADSAAAMDAEFVGAMKEPDEGSLLRGRVVAINPNEVVVDIGYKSEGVINRSEFIGPTGEMTVKVGDEVYVCLEHKEGFDGEVILSHARAERMRTWDKITKAYEANTPVDAVATKRVKGGLMADLGGVEAFLPGSQVSLKTIANLDQFIGKTISVRILKLNKRRSNIVVSRRVILEEEAEKTRTELMASIEAGQVRPGTVKTITAYGAFVDLGGVDGLLHITDMSWGRINHPSQVVKVDQEIEVKILAVDREKGKVSLGLKQKTSDPWSDITKRYAAGQAYEGKITTLVEYGAFVQLEDGVEGLVHISEMAWGKKLKHPSEAFKAGSTVKVKLLGVDQKNKRISLSIRQAESDPWDTVAERYQYGTKITGVVRGVAEFGAFIEVEDGIEGLVHVSDMTWSKTAQNPSEILKKGDQVTVVVLGSDKEHRRLSLGIKQLQPDPWDNIRERYRVGMTVKATVTSITAFGAFASLDDVIEGLIPLAQLSAKAFKKPEEVMQVGQEINVKITKIQPQAHKIALSARMASGQEPEPQP